MSINFEIDDELSYAQNLEAFTKALEELASDLAPALAKELELDHDDPTHDRDAVLGRLFSAIDEKTS